MNDFTFYFTMGWNHIISTDALDHLLFIAALASIYLFPNWKQVLVLITAFTIGHCITLVLSSVDLIRFNSNWVEFLIPVTIVITALSNFFVREYKPRALRLNYFLAFFFGLIHGMGFANAIRFMLAKSQSIVVPLVSFNLGLEAGQIMVVLFMLLLALFLVTKAGIKRKWWVWSISATAGILAINMCLNRWPL